MARITTFTELSLDGYYAGPNGEQEWFHGRSDPEFDAFTVGRAQSGGALILGRRTYENMKQFWPSEEAGRALPEMTAVMRNRRKIVFSRTMGAVADEPNWKNVDVWSEIDPALLKKTKENEDSDMAILGSGSIVQQLTRLGLIDEYTLVVNPIILGAGKRLFENVDQTWLDLRDARSFANGVVWMQYTPVG